MEDKLAIQRDAFGPEGSVRAAIERPEVGSGAIYTWRRQAMSGALTGITRPAMPSFCRCDTLRVQLARLKRMQFGEASEKLSHEIAQLELALEELEAEAATVSARRVDPATLDQPAPARALPAHLPGEEQRIEPKHGSCTCSDCGGALRPLGQDSDEMLDAVPVH